MLFKLSAVAARAPFVGSLVGALALMSVSLVATPASAQPAVGFPQGTTPQKRALPPRALAPRNLQVTPRSGFKGPTNPGVRGPGFRGPSNVYRGPGPGPGFRGPGGPGLRGPAVGFRGPSGITTFRGGRATFIRGPHRIRRHGSWLPLAAIGVLGGITIGSRYYTPYAYVDGPSPDACTGPTDDGMCELRLTEVPLVGGGAELQCVAYCPQ